MLPNKWVIAASLIEYCGAVHGDKVCDLPVERCNPEFAFLIHVHSHSCAWSPE